MISMFHFIISMKFDGLNFLLITQISDEEFENESRRFGNKRVNSKNGNEEF